MHYTIAHELSGRIRFRLEIPTCLHLEEQLITSLLTDVSGVQKIKYNLGTGSLLVHYSGAPPCRQEIISILESITLDTLVRKKNAALPAKEDPNYQINKAKRAIIFRVSLLVARPIIPVPIRMWFLIRGISKLVLAAVKPLSKGKLNSDVLDASAVISAFLMNEAGTARTIILLLQIGGYLEEWTKQKSKQSLAKLYQLKSEWVWIEKNKTEIRIPGDEVKPGDIVVVRDGTKIPVDGTVLSGNASVNQASMTGEPLPVPKYKGITVYAGTVVADGKLRIRAEKVNKDTRISQIVKVIEESEERKASIQSDAEKLADKIVPYSFMLSGVIYLLTGNIYKAASALLVDYSCALKLSTPLTMMSAMISASKQGVLIKGGKYIEELSQVNAFVLDKTGTLTKGAPVVDEIISFNGFDRDYLLRNVACIEEHFPHPVATAVVKKAEKEGLDHDENHSEVNYIVAHGIASTIDKQEILVGSKHFINEDNGVDVSLANHKEKEFVKIGNSLLYVAIGGQLAGLISIKDPVRPDAIRLVKKLGQLDIKKVVMITGDNRGSAEKIAKEVGISNYFSDVFPEQKTKLINDIQNTGHNVAMVGDGINDSPALATASVGISMSHGADIAQEACDILLLKNNLDDIVYAYDISNKAIKRIKQNFKYIVGINTFLISSGLMGLLPPIFSAFMHNATTVLVSANALRKY